MMTFRSAWWWQVPQFVEAQNDPNFRAWAEAIEQGIDLFVDTPSDWFLGIPEHDWFSDEAINFVESKLLEKYPDVRALDADIEGQWPFIKYLGQAYVDKLEASWVSIPRARGYWEEPGSAVEFPWRFDWLYEIDPALVVAVRRRTGNEWLFTFNNNRQDYLAWKRDGTIFDRNSQRVVAPA